MALSGEQKKDLFNLMRFIEGIFIPYPGLTKEAKAFVDEGKRIWLEFMLSSSIEPLLKQQNPPEWIKETVKNYIASPYEYESMLLGFTQRQQLFPEQNITQGIQAAIGYLPSFFMQIIDSYLKNSYLKALSNKFSFEIECKERDPYLRFIHWSHTDILSPLEEPVKSQSVIKSLYKKNFNHPLKFQQRYHLKDYPATSLHLEASIDTEGNVLYSEESERTLRQQITEAIEDKLHSTRDDIEETIEKFKKYGGKATANPHLPKLNEETITRKVNVVVQNAKTSPINRLSSNGLMIDTMHIDVSNAEGYKTLNNLVEGICSID